MGRTTWAATFCQLPRRCVLLCAAPLCQAVDIHSPGCETEEEEAEEEEMEGRVLIRETRSSTLSGAGELWAFCLAIASA